MWQGKMSCITMIVPSSPINTISNEVKIPRVGTNNTYLTNACKTLWRSLVPSSFTTFNTKIDENKSTRNKVANDCTKQNLLINQWVAQQLTTSEARMRIYELLSLGFENWECGNSTHGPHISVQLPTILIHNISRYFCKSSGISFLTIHVGW